jgi:hypothetical protein
MNISLTVMAARSDFYQRIFSIRVVLKAAFEFQSKNFYQNPDHKTAENLEIFKAKLQKSKKIKPAARAK